MRTRAHRAAAALAAAATLLAPAAAAAFRWEGRLGLEYRNDAQWVRTQPRADAARLDVDTALSLRGAFPRPGVFDWEASGGYRAVRADSDTAGRDDHDRLIYGVRTTVFGNPRSPFTASAFARRTVEDYTVESGSGDYELNSAGGTLRFASRAGPSLDAGYEYSDLANGTPDGRLTHRYIHAVNATAAQRTASSLSNVGYNGQFSEGTFANDNFDEHRVTATSHIRLGVSTTSDVIGGWYRRDPTAPGPFNVGQELSTFSGILQHSYDTERDPQALGRGTSRRHQGSYQYAHGLQRGAAGDQERTLQRLAYLLDRAITGQPWRVRVEGSATYNELRLAGTRDRTAGQNVTALAFWRRATELHLVELHAGPSLGLLERMPGDPAERDETRLGGGAEAGLRLRRTRPTLTLGGEYTATWSRDLGLEGTRVHQVAAASAEAPAGLAVIVGRISADDDRFDGPGASASRSFTAQVDYRRRQGSVSLLGSLSDGVAGALRDPFGGGTFLAPSYDVHTASALLTGTLHLHHTLSSFANARYAMNDYPDRPVLDEWGVGGGLVWSVGALRISVEDRYVVAETEAGERRVNQVWVRAYRVFGGGF